MKLFSVKALFVKELEDIVAPLERIKTDIHKFIERSEAAIEKDASEVSKLITKNKARVESNVKASNIIKNLEALLGVN